MSIEIFSIIYICAARPTVYIVHGGCTIIVYQSIAITYTETAAEKELNGQKCEAEAEE